MEVAVSPSTTREHPLMLSDALRALGLGFEAFQPQRIRLSVDADGIIAYVPSPYGVRFHPWSDLEIQQRTWQAHRAPRPTQRAIQESWSLARWSVRLRAVGALLDSQGICRGTVEATATCPDPPQNAEVHVYVAGQSLVDTAMVRQYLLRLRLRHDVVLQGAASPTPSEPSRWWAPWRRDS